MIRKLCLALAGAAVLAVQPAAAQEPPAQGVSPRIDAIRKAGVLRVGVLANLPWLAENTKSDGGEPWTGPAWMLAKEYARAARREAAAGPRSSHETKVPVLAANQVDMTITPLAETPERLKVDRLRDLFDDQRLHVRPRRQRRSSPKPKSVDDLNNPDVTIAYFIGGGEEGWVKERFPKAKLRGVTDSGATAPVEEVMARRADAAPINRVPWVGMNKKVKGLAVLPKANNCQDSKEKAAPGRPRRRQEPGRLPEWLRAVAERMKTQLDADERKVIETL